VVADSRSPRDGAFVESIGTYNPLNQPSVIVLDEERARHWIQRGAQPSDRVAKILAIQGIAEIPSKLQARIELGKKRAEEAKTKPKDDGLAAEPPVSEASATPVAEAEEEAATAQPAEEPAAEASEPAAGSESPATEEEAAQT
jgi:small subunit ribosomal protein S16